MVTSAGAADWTVAATGATAAALATLRVVAAFTCAVAADTGVATLVASMAAADDTDATDEGAALAGVDVELVAVESGVTAEAVFEITGAAELVAA